MKQVRLLAALGMMVAIFVCIQRAKAQAPPGTIPDANDPSGPPGPMKSDDIWHVDSLSGALTVRIPFTTTPKGGRGPVLPIGLLYNSSATTALQVWGMTSTGGGDDSGVTCGFMNGCVLVGDGGLPGSAGSINSYNATLQYIWAPGGATAPASAPPSGPWTTTGPAIYAQQSFDPDQFFNVGPTTIDGGYGCTVFGPYTYHDENGDSHDMNIQVVQQNSQSDQSANCSGMQSGSFNSATFDGSALVTTPNGITYPDGTMTGANSSGATFEDTNGNIASVVPNGSGPLVGTDSLERKVFTTNLPGGIELAAPNGTGITPPASFTVTTYSAANLPQTYTIQVGTATTGSFSMPHPTSNDIATMSDCLTNITCPTAYVVGRPGGSVAAITSITLPNTSVYEISYDSTYATISKIIFPTGGYVRFVWGVRGIGNMDIGKVGLASTVVVTDIYISTGSGTENHWSYSYPNMTAPGSITSTETEPDGTTIQYTGSGFYYSLYNAQSLSPTWQETFRSIKNSSGALVESVATTYANGNYPAPATGYGKPSQIATTLYDGQNPIQKQVQFVYDTWGNVVEQDESDWYGCSGSPCTTPSGPPNGWLQRTFTSYLWSNPNAGQPANNYSQAHIVNKPSQVLVTDGSGHPYSLVQYFYDQTAVSGSTGYTNHDDKNYSTTSTNPRGNLTTESHCSILATTATVTSATAASSCSQWLNTTHTYDLAGQLLSTTDPNHSTTGFSYVDSYVGTPPGPTDGYVTTVTYPLGYTDNYSYNYYPGELASHTDWNKQLTKYLYNDPGNMNRLTEMQYPDGGDVQTCYSDFGATQNCTNNPLPPAVTVKTATGGAEGFIVRTTLYDGLGRVSQTQLNTDPNGSDLVDTQYDNSGRVYSVSTPYRSTTDPTHGLTFYPTYDALNRKTSQIDSDEVSTQSWSYAGNTVTYTDENKNQWQRTTDGLGRLTKVLEPTGTAQTGTIQPPGLETDYSYNAVGDLLSVKQCGGLCPSTSAVGRSFTYDGMSRLIQSFNPEAGWTCYGMTGGAAPNGANCTSGYDGDGNLLYKTDARAVLTSYSYDGMNRLLGKSYSNDASSTPSSCYQYGMPTNIGFAGRLLNSWTLRASAGICSSSLPATGYSTSAPNGYLTLRSIALYDSMGRIKNEQQCTPSNCSSGTPYQPAYTYDLAGNQLSFTSGNQFSFLNAYDGAGRLLTVTNNSSNPTPPLTLFSAQVGQALPCPNSLTATYSAFGGLMNAAFGNGLTLNRAYDKRLRNTCETDTGGIISTQTPGSAAVTVVGAEQTQ